LNKLGLIFDACLFALFHLYLACLHDQNKVAFCRAGFYPANQSNLNSIQKALIGWKKAGPPKSHCCFDHVNRLIVLSLESEVYAII